MKSLTVILLVVAISTLSIKGFATEKQQVFGDVHLVYLVDDFSDEESEILAVTETGFMPKNIAFIYSAETGLVFGYTHQSFILEDAGRIKYRINKNSPVTLKCRINSGSLAAYVFDQAVAKRFLSALVVADTTSTLNLVIMVDGESETKAQFDLAGVARAVETAKMIKLQ